MKNVFEFLRQMTAQGRFFPRPEETKEAALQRFWEETAACGPLLIPGFHFTEEENRLMDEILAEERQAKDHASRIIEQKPSRVFVKQLNIFTVAFLWVLTATSLSAYAQRSDERRVTGEEYARQQVKAVANGLKGVPLPKPLLPTKAVAIATVEPILFSIYGKVNITQQRPYEAYLIDGSWYISGTLPEGYLGGVFEIMVDANDGRVVYLTHGK